MTNGEGPERHKVVVQKRTKDKNEETKHRNKQRMNQRKFYIETSEMTDFQNLKSVVC